MYCILEHVVHKIRIWLDKLIQHLQLLYLFTLLFVKHVKVDFLAVELHIRISLRKVCFLLGDLFVTLFKLFLFLLYAPDFFVYLLLHHLVQVLLLDVKLLHYTAEGFFKAVYLFIELFTHFKLQF